jgi:hypothetical protein
VLVPGNSSDRRSAFDRQGVDLLRRHRRRDFTLGRLDGGRLAADGDRFLHALQSQCEIALELEPDRQRHVLHVGG